MHLSSKIFLSCIFLTVIIFTLVFSGCGKSGVSTAGKSEDGKHRFVVIDPGHFHASLLFKRPGYEDVSSDVAIYAPVDDDFTDHMARVVPFNTRKENPASWNYYARLGTDYFEKAMEEKFGDIVTFSGRNNLKMDRIAAAVDAGYNVLSDKPWVIDPEKLPVLETALNKAEQKGLVIYDLMTERHEITSILQKLLVMDESVFGKMTLGTPEAPALVKSSIHYLSKIVAGRQLKRPWWFFDTSIQGEGLVDITTHLVDLSFLILFPERAIDKNDIKLIDANHWPTILQPKQFEKITGFSEFPAQFKLNDDGNYPYYCNGSLVFTLDGIHIKSEVIWNYESPTGDTHYSIIKGSKAHILILQGREQNFKPELYVKPVAGVSLQSIGDALNTFIKKISDDYPGLSVVNAKTQWRIDIPDKYRVGHEAHFGQVADAFLKYLGGEPMPAWEKANMIAKYYLTTNALKMCREKE